MFISPSIILTILILSVNKMAREELTYDAWTRDVSETTISLAYMIFYTMKVGPSPQNVKEKKL